MESVFVSVCSRNTAYWHMFTAFQIAAAHLGQEKGIMCKLSPYVGDSLISRARCIALKNFLDSDSKWFFSVDDDIELPPHALTRLIDADKDIIGGIYRLKGDKPKTNPYAIRWADGEVNVGANDIVKVQYISTGCVMFKRDFVEELVDSYRNLWFYENMTGRKIPALYMPYIYNNEYLSEDWALCQRAIDKDHDIWLHSGVQCGHWGLYNYKLSDLKAAEKEF